MTASVATLHQAPEAEPAPPTFGVPSVASANAPHVFIDGATAFGCVGAVVRITVEAHAPLRDAAGNLVIERMVTGHLRMSMEGAVLLRDAINSALLIGVIPATDAQN